MITCGHCKGQHQTVAEVRSCSTGAAVQPSTPPARNFKPATEAQVRFLKKLIVERLEGVDEITAEHEESLRNLSTKGASEYIDALLRQAPKAAVVSGHQVTGAVRDPYRYGREVERARREGATRTSHAELEPGTYTLVRPDGTWRTFAIAHAKWADNKLVASYLSGPDNELSYTACAFVSGGRVSMFKKFREDGQLAADLRALTEADPHEAHERFLAEAESYALRSGKCMRCLHKLTVPASLHRGLGPVCAAIEGVA